MGIGPTTSTTGYPLYFEPYRPIDQNWSSYSPLAFQPPREELPNTSQVSDNEYKHVQIYYHKKLSSEEKDSFEVIIPPPSENGDVIIEGKNYGTDILIRERVDSLRTLLNAWNQPSVERPEYIADILDEFVKETESIYECLLVFMQIPQVTILSFLKKERDILGIMINVFAVNTRIEKGNDKYEKLCSDIDNRLKEMNFEDFFPWSFE